MPETREFSGVAVTTCRRRARSDRFATLPARWTARVEPASLGPSPTWFISLSRSSTSTRMLFSVELARRIFGDLGGKSALLLGAGALWTPWWAFAGALFSTLLVFSLAHGRGNWDTTRLLLTGVVLAAGWGALISLLLATSPGTHVHGMLFWLMGDLSAATVPVTGSLVLILIALPALLLSASLNLLSGGELKAASLGVAIGRLRITIYILASLATATAVTQAGNVGFIGLIAPHILRLTGARDHRVLLPGVIFLGGTLLLVADALSRLVIAPGQLPVGILTALIGVPLFLYLLYRSGSTYDA